MKLLLLVLFLIMSFTLPALSLFAHKSDKKVVLLFFGMIIYLLATVLVSFFSQAYHIVEYVSVSDKLQYVFILSLMLSLAIFIVSKATKNICIGDNGSAIYAGYSFLNVFVYNMSSYGLLILVGLFRSTGKLVQMYGSEYATQLTAYYDGISVVSILALIAELLLTFYILYRLFCRFIAGDKKASDLLSFFVFTMLMYMIQFLCSNTIFALALYATEAAIVSGKWESFLKRNLHS
ncbi:MAG: hypothetical protein IJF95_00665 [Erysipelotrichaceae bacterium]|nr:hypothetical protein [Erysipelotrichaceae bacterium]